MNLAVVLGLAYIMAGRRDLWRRPAVVQAQATAQPVAQVSQSEDHSHAMAPR
jgi:hypothetical protein